jgi:hypothetical protein
LSKGAGLPKEIPSLPEGADVASMKLNGVTNITNLAGFNSLLMPSSTRFAFHSFTYVNSADYLDKLMSLLQTENMKLPYLSFSFIGVQPFSKTVHQNGIKMGGHNAIGLEDLHPNDDIIVVLLLVSWTQKNRDAAVKTWSKNFMAAAQTLAKRMNVYSPYVYTNYAYDGQNTMATYSTQAQEFLRQVCKKI